LGIPHGMSVKFGFWSFHKLWKRQKIFDFIDFWLPYSWHFRKECKKQVYKRNWTTAPSILLQTYKLF